MMKNNISEHTFHIPVMGLGYTIDTPIKVAQFGISSVVSIIQDGLVEQMREFYCNKSGEKYSPIPLDEIDHRAKRITAYLNLIQQIVDKQITILKNQPFKKGNDINTYIELLPENSNTKHLFLTMLTSKGNNKVLIDKEIRRNISAGSIDVNIMTKIDNQNYSKEGQLLSPEYSDAISAFRGFAESNLSSSIIFSAGLNPRLFAYIEKYNDFFPDVNGNIKKKIVLKVSDFRSAQIQGKFLAKKGVWVTEFRIESGLNCGGHAFPTDGYLLGPILEEFKIKKQSLVLELLTMCNRVLRDKNLYTLPITTTIRISAQGGIGTAKEDEFLRKYYEMDGTGWGSPFLLVPEATSVDNETLNQLVNAKQADYYLSYASPLGVPFNNFRKSSSEEQRKSRILKQRPGSPCYKKHLAFNTEFTQNPVCISSREYQNFKLKELASLNLTDVEFKKKSEEVTEKDCLCEGLASSTLLKYNLPISHRLKAVSICPGPNLAYFSKIISLKDMIDHIYGRASVLNNNYRQHLFINELIMYVDYFKEHLSRAKEIADKKKVLYLSVFKTNILQGIAYYEDLIPKMRDESDEIRDRMLKKIGILKGDLIDNYVL